MDNNELNKLEALAKAATPGPWHVTKYCSVMDEGMDTLVVSSDSSHEDRAYIAAANPAAILELIALARHSLPVDAEGDDKMIEEAVKSNNVYGVLPNSASTMSIGRAVLAAHRAALARAGSAAPAAPTFWKSQAKMIERAIIGLRDGWATRKDADDALAILAAPAAAQDEWISVEDDRKPKGRTPILVTVDYVRYGEYEDGTPGEWRGQIVTEGEYVPQHGEVGDYFTSYSSPHGDGEAVTHWMPIPAPAQPKDTTDTKEKA